MAQIRISLDSFKEQFSSYTELSSVALGATVTSVSDEFFAEASHLLKVDPAPNLKGSFGPNGALYSGWESRRHNPTFDWCIIRLGAPGRVYGFDIDTSHFNGNEAPTASVEALFTEGDTHPTHSDERWERILPKVTLGPNSRHLFKPPPTGSRETFNYVKLNMYPDGGIARFRVYGLVAAVFPTDPSELLDLAHVFAGGRVVYTSDQHFGVGSNLLLPGRGEDMGDGWETKRSREKGHKDQVILRLGQLGRLDHVEIDTNHFKGNYPESCELHACNTAEIVPTVTENEWTTVLSRNKLGPHRRHFFQLQNVANKDFTHVRVTIYPDGGLKRVRVMGRRNALQGTIHLDGNTKHTEMTYGSSGTPVTSEGIKTFPNAIVGSKTASISPQQSVELNTSLSVAALPITTEAFAPFGQVLMAWTDPASAPRGVKVTSANQNTAHKFHNLSQVENSYPAGSNARTGFSVYRSTPGGANFGEGWKVKLLERHPYTNQAFIPMGSSDSIQEDGLQNAGRAYLVVVALDGDDNRPNLQTLRAFIASTSQGIVYNAGIWHHPMITLERAIDFTCVETQIGGDNKLDCEVLDLEEFPVILLPRM